MGVEYLSDDGWTGYVTLMQEEVEDELDRVGHDRYEAVRGTVEECTRAVDTAVREAREAYRDGADPAMLAAEYRPVVAEDVQRAVDALRVEHVPEVKGDPRDVGREKRIVEVIQSQIHKGTRRRNTLEKNRKAHLKLEDYRLHSLTLRTEIDRLKTEMRQLQGLYLDLEEQVHQLEAVRDSFGDYVRGETNIDEGTVADILEHTDVGRNPEAYGFADWDALEAHLKDWTVFEDTG